MARRSIQKACKLISGLAKRRPAAAGRGVAHRGSGPIVLRRPGITLININVMNSQGYSISNCRDGVCGVARSAWDNKRLADGRYSGWPGRTHAAWLKKLLDKNERSFYKADMGKGEQTRQAILDEAFSLASCVGVGGLSIGMLAERTRMSKSGLFAHFGSKEELQLAVLREAQQRFAEVVLRPAFRQPRGLGRLRTIVVNWLDWTREANLPGGCVINAAAAEFDDQPGPLRDEARRGLMALRQTLADTVSKAVAAGELRADTDAEQFAFELIGIYQVTHQSRRLLDDPDADRRALVAFDRLVRDYAVPATKE